MSFNASLCRWLIVASVAISVSFTGVVPPLRSAAASAAESLRTNGTVLPCCCGGDDDRCCGMACCVPRSPVTPQAPLPAPSADEHQPTSLGMARIHAGALCLGRKPRPIIQQAQAAFTSSAEVSLQSLQVRLDV